MKHARFILALAAALVICNGGPKIALGASGSCASYLSPGTVLEWTSFSNGSQHAHGQLSITKVDGEYFEAIQTGSNAGAAQTRLYGMTTGNFFGLLNPGHDEAWMGNCSGKNITGHVKDYQFTITR